MRTIQGQPSALNSLDELAAAAVDAVYVATHPDSHAEICIQALRPASMSYARSRRPSTQRQLTQILAAAHRCDRLFMEAMKPPFFPLYCSLRRHLAADPIGPIGFVRAGHADATRPPDYPLFFPELAGGGIMGIGPYEAFLALDWLGPLKRVQTMGRVGGSGLDMLALFQTEHERGMAQLHTGLDLLSRGDALLCGPGGMSSSTPTGGTQPAPRSTTWTAAKWNSTSPASPAASITKPATSAAWSAKVGAKAP